MLYDISLTLYIYKTVEREREQAPIEMIRDENTGSPYSSHIKKIAFSLNNSVHTPWVCIIQIRSIDDAPLKYSFN